MTSRRPLYPLYPGWFLWVLTLLGGCTADYPVNDRIHQAEPKRGYYVDDPRATRRSDSLLVVLAFSGGGTRAAAFSYGVLEKLARTVIMWDGRPRRLLDEVDLISSVSGGSFTAAYYGLFGDRIFEDFEDKFLKKDVQSALIALLSSPTSWPSLWSSRYNRSELAADLYDEILFEGKTLGDIQESGGPFVVINATDIELGSRFAFDQRQFDPVCSDAARFPVSRAVAASAAVLNLFSEVAVRNYAGTCHYALPEWALQALDTRDVSARSYQLAVRDRAYLDGAQRPFIHLLDGGLSDNLGIRPFANSLKSAASVPLNSYNFETLSLIRDLMVTWDEDITVGRCWDLARQGMDQTSCYDMDHVLIEVSFDQIADEVQRERFKRLPTGFRLPVETEAWKNRGDPGRRIEPLVMYAVAIWLDRDERELLLVQRYAWLRHGRIQSREVAYSKASCISVQRSAVTFFAFLRGRLSAPASSCRKPDRLHPDREVP